MMSQPFISLAEFDSVCEIGLISVRGVCIWRCEQAGVFKRAVCIQACKRVSLLLLNLTIPVKSVIICDKYSKYNIL